jgi:hypothetical protein
MLVGVGYGANAIYAALPHGAVDRAHPGDLSSHGVRCGTQSFGSSISKAIDGQRNLGSSPFGRFTLGLALGLVVLALAKAASAQSPRRYNRARRK